MRNIEISKFRANCFGLIEQIHKTGEPLRIMRYGVPVAEVVPICPDRKRQFLGDMIGTAEIVGDIVSPVIVIETEG
jgi:antitoxin (DNA-binding transcriptional repressor) of toxin-antitoxin stability system